MRKQEVLAILKADIGITTTRQDQRLESLINGIESELEKRQGITLDIENRLDHAMFLVDYARYRYTNQREPMPEHLRWRLRNLYVGEGGGPGAIQP